MDRSFEFKLRRQRCGLFQEDVAEALGVRPLTVKRWEKEGQADAPDAAWEFLADEEAARRGRAGAIVDAAKGAGGSVASLPFPCVPAEGEGADERRARSAALLAADELERMGFAVSWIDPSEQAEAARAQGVWSVTAQERVFALIGGDVRDGDAYPAGRDPEELFTGSSRDEAWEAAEEFAAEHPWEWFADGGYACVSYWRIEGLLLDAEDEPIDRFAMSTLTEDARRRLLDYADRWDEAMDELEDEWPDD